MTSMTRVGAPLGPERRRAHLHIVDDRWNDGEHTETQLDALTGLPNRLGWDETITRADAARARSPMTASVVALDVDCLTLANETRGHDFGDELLRTVANLVRRVIRDEDLVARIGGDEFGVLLPGADRDSLRQGGDASARGVRCRNVARRLPGLGRGGRRDGYIHRDAYQGGTVGRRANVHGQD